MGGDWYDVIPIPGGGVGLVMGDVAGKGLAAASMVGQLRSALRAYALEGHEPATVVEQLNRLVWAEADDSQMATLLYAWSSIRPRARCAGSTPGIRRRCSWPARRRRTSSRAAARSRSACCPSRATSEVSTRMDPGSTIVLYTGRAGGAPRRAHRRGDGAARRRVGEAPPELEPLFDHLMAPWCPPAGTLTTSRCSRSATCRSATASAPSSRPSPSRSPPCARCCAAGCATAGRASRRSPRSRRPAARRPRTPSSTPAAGGVVRGLGRTAGGSRVEITVRTTAPGAPREGDQGGALAHARADGYG